MCVLRFVCVCVCVRVLYSMWLAHCLTQWRVGGRWREWALKIYFDCMNFSRRWVRSAQTSDDTPLWKKPPTMPCDASWHDLLSFALLQNKQRLLSPTFTNLWFWLQTQTQTSLLLLISALSVHLSDQWTLTNLKAEDSWWVKYRTYAGM